MKRFLLPQGEPVFQVLNLLDLFGQLPRLLGQSSIALDQRLAQPFILPSQPFDLPGRPPFRHVSDGTPIRRSVQDHLN
jgi:hypothetical protein